MNRLSHRLSALAEWVLPGQAMADIGGDHALLAAYLLEQGICPRAIITDINPAPLRRAEQALSRKGLSGRFACRLGDGLSPLAAGEVGTVCIAGMGGQTIADILEKAGEKLTSFPRLLLQPMNVFPPLHRFLARSGYRSTRERVVREDGGFFIIMEVSTRPGSAYALSPLAEEVGTWVLDHPREENNRAYLEHWLEKYRERERAMRRSSRSEIKLQREEVLQSIKQLEGVLTSC